MNCDEMQPATTPTIMGSEKDTTVLIENTPATASTTTSARKVVREVSTVRPRVWFRLRSMVSTNYARGPSFRLFSRTRS